VIRAPEGTGEPARTSGTLRASDDDRDATIGVLNEAVTVGRLTADEHADRVESALRAQTLGELSVLTTDLASPTARLRVSMPRVVVAVLVVIVAAVTGVLVASQGTSSPIQTTRNQSASPSDGFVAAEPSLAGRFCRGLLASRRSEPSGPSVLGTGPASDPWGTQTIIVPTQPSTRFLQDFAAVRSLENATSVVQMAWQKNGYQYSQLTPQCLTAYDSHFQWQSSADPSAGAGAVSVSYADRHSLLAARSDSGTCWYELNVMGPGDPIMAQDDLPSYGVFFAKSSTGCAADAVPSGADWESADPLPPQLTQS